MTNSLHQTIKAVAVIGRELAISWSDGTEQFLPLKSVRQYCPCAHCVGEPDVTGKREPVEKKSLEEKSESFSLKKYEFVGGYGLQFTWGDGHNSGIYSYSYLRKLSNY